MTVIVAENFPTLKYLLPYAVHANSVHPDFHLVNPTGECLPEGIGVDGQAFRVEANHLAAVLAVKMRVGAVEGVGRQTVIKGPAAGAEPLDQAMVDEQIQDAVNRYAVDGTAALQGFIYVAG